MEISTLLFGRKTRKEKIFTKLNMALLAAIFLFVAGLSLQGQTVITDETDYLPGEIVKIEGNDWTPGAIVDLVITEDPDIHLPHVFQATVNKKGNFFNSELVIHP